MSDKLKNCPFCGSEAGSNQFTIFGCSTPDCFAYEGSGVDYDDHSIEVEMWNRRVRNDSVDVQTCRNQVRLWMQENKISFRKLEAKCGIAASNLCQMINGKRSLGAKSIDAIYSVMNKEKT